MKKNCEVSLYGLGQLALILKSNSGVIYRNQAGGYACLQPSEEGILTILDDDTMALLIKISNYTRNKTYLTIEDAQNIDEIFQSCSEASFIMIDRDMLGDSMEAWIHVNINQEKTDNSMLKRFIETKGILTWNNSD